MVCKFGQMAWNMRAIGSGIERSTRAVSSCQTETITRVRYCSIKLMGKALTSISLDLHILESGKTTKYMVMELNLGQTVSTIRAAMREGSNTA